MSNAAEGQQEETRVMQVRNPMAEVAERGGAGVPVQSGGGLVSIEAQRAVAEVQARMMIARSNPRNPRRAVDMILQDCQRIGLAEDAEYAYSRGGTEISGPSIRLAEAIAARWGNIASGIKEINRGAGYSECVAYAWDLESGYYDERQFQVRHWRDTKKGGYALEDERDIYELIANMGQRRKRAVLLTVLPGDVVDAARQQCAVTLKAKADTTPEGVSKMIAAFGEYGVSKEQIEQRLQRRIDSIQPAQMVGLKRIYASLRDGMSEPGDWFEPVPVAGAKNEAPRGSAGLKQAIKTQAAPATEPEPAPQEERQPENKADAELAPLAPAPAAEPQQEKSAKHRRPPVNMPE